MIIKKIDEKTYEDFVKDHELASLYQSPEWKKTKELENKKCELVGLYKSDSLVGVSLIIYLSVLRKEKCAYASRGFIYDYEDIPAFKEALKRYFKDVVFVRIDAPVILAKYDVNLKKEENPGSYKLINQLIENGFKHFGFNMADEAMQFRFIHRLPVLDTWENQLKMMSKSSRKNIELAAFKGVKCRICQKDELEEVKHFFDLTLERKNVKGFSQEFYENLINAFQDNITMYLIYIDKKTYIKNLKLKLEEVKKSFDEVIKKMEHDHIGDKLKTAKLQAENSIRKYEEELNKASFLEDITNIASMFCITKYHEVVSLSSGMDNNYRDFCPKYAMYPEMIKMAIANKLSYVNFLGVKNIFDENDADHGVYEVKRGFGGETIEYIGEFDLPIKPLLYKFYKTKNKIMNKKK